MQPGGANKSTAAGEEAKKSGSIRIRTEFMTGHHRSLPPHISSKMVMELRDLSPAPKGHTINLLDYGGGMIQVCCKHAQHTGKLHDPGVLGRSGVLTRLGVF